MSGAGATCVSCVKSSKAESVRRIKYSQLSACNYLKYTCSELLEAEKIYQYVYIISRALSR